MSDKKENRKYAFGSYGYWDPESEINWYEFSGKEWVFWGPDNLYPQRLIELYKGSAINHTCIDAKVDAVVGEGMYAEDPVLNAKLKRANPDETWDDILTKITLDYELFGGFALNVIWNKAGDKIAEVYHVDFSAVRAGQKDENYKVNEYWYTPRWDLYTMSSRKRNYKPISYPTFNSDDTRGDQSSQIYYYYGYSPGNEYYPSCSYIGALNDIEIDKEVSLYHASNLNNGLTPSMVINFRNGIPDSETQQRLYREFEESYAGANRAGRFFLTFSETPETTPEITPLSLTGDTYYIQLEQRLTSRILTGHRISSPLLLGIREGGSGLGSNSQELLMAYSHFIQTVVGPSQDILLKQINKMFRYMGFEDPDILIKNKPMLEEDILIADAVPEEEKVIEEPSKESSNPLMDEVKSKLLQGLPKNMQ